MKDLNKPFYEWNDWIKSYFDQILNEYTEKRSKRLDFIGKFQAKKIFGNHFGIGNEKKEKK